jgi:hypothetical protein
MTEIDDDSQNSSEKLVKWLRRDADVADRSYPEVFHVSADMAREAADRIEALEREQKSTAAKEFVEVAGDVDRLIATARREALEEAAMKAWDHWRNSPARASVCADIAAAIRALKEGE